MEYVSKEKPQNAPKKRVQKIGAGKPLSNWYISTRTPVLSQPNSETIVVRAAALAQKKLKTKQV